MTTSAMVSSSSNSTSFTEARMVVVRSVMTCTLIALGSDASICGSSSLNGVDHADDVGSGLALNVQNDGGVCR